MAYRTGSSYFDRISHVTGGGKLGNSIILTGFNEAVGSAAFETVWPHGGIRPRPPGELLMSLRSTSIADTLAGTGAHVVRVSCLDINGVEFSENVVLNGTTLVPMTKPAFRVLPSGVVAHGSSPTNEGTITIENAGTVYEVIPLAFGVASGGSQSAAYTVPKDRVAFVDEGSWLSGDNQGIFTVQFLADLPGIGRRSLVISIKDSSQRKIGVCYPQGTDLEILAKAETGTAVLTITLLIIPVVKFGGQCP